MQRRESSCPDKEEPPMHQAEAAPIASETAAQAGGAIEGEDEDDDPPLQQPQHPPRDGQEQRPSSGERPSEVVVNIGRSFYVGPPPLLSPWLSRHCTYGRLHMAYFIVISTIGTACLWGFPKRGKGAGLTFMDSMYNAVSSACTTGLISVRMRTFSDADDVLLMLFMIFGSTITTALIPLFIRQYQFDRNIRHLEATIQRQHRRVHPSVMSSDGLVRARFKDSSAKRRQDKLDSMHLDAEAASALSWIVLAFFLCSILLGFVVLEAFILLSPSAKEIIRSRGVNHVFFSLFTAISSVTNSGILLLDDNMVPLRGHWGILLFMSFLILIGNTMFAPCLRATIVVLRRFSRDSRRKVVFDYLLNNPRKCFTHLFSPHDTVWLVVTVMAFNAVESIAFYILSWDSSSLKGLNIWGKVVNGIFQSITTRSAGLNVVPIGSLSPPMLVLYIGMMYIAVYPVYLTRKKSQAQADDDPQDKYGPHPSTAKDNLLTQSRKLVARDSAYLFMIIFILCSIENRRIESDPLNFSIFNIIFEAISAYGNVGLSVGYNCDLYREIHSSGPSSSCVDVPYSFSGTWSVCGKLLMIVIMLMGRNRGLPDDMDMAVQLPKGFDEDEEEQIQLSEQIEQQFIVDQGFHQQFEQMEEVMEQQEHQQQQLEMIDFVEQEQLKPKDTVVLDVL